MFQEYIARAVADRVIPGVVLLANTATPHDHDADVSFEMVVGQSSLEVGAEQPLRRDAVFPLYSLTKLVTAVLVLRAVGRGQVDLDADVAKVLPELAAQKVLTTSTKLVDRQRPLTLRLLLTHASGVGYRFLADALADWPVDAASDEPLVLQPTPLLFEPGTAWAYGAGADWAGRLLERVTGQPLEALVQQDVLAPLGLPAGALTFFPHRFPDVLARLWPSLPRRPGPGEPLTHSPSPFTDAVATVAQGGSGLFGTAPAFLRVLTSLLRDDGRLLPSAAVADLWTPQLSAASREALVQTTRHGTWITGDVPDTGEYDWSLAGLLVTGPAHPWRRPGAVLWSGAMNLSWIIDREAGLCALYASSFQPPGDVQGNEVIHAWEEFIYGQLARQTD